jgi:hypothetical protein
MLTIVQDYCSRDTYSCVRSARPSTRIHRSMDCSLMGYENSMVL